MKKLIPITLISIVFFLSSCGTGKKSVSTTTTTTAVTPGFKITAPDSITKTPVSAMITPAYTTTIHSSNFIVESASAWGAYEFTQAGDYKIVIMDVGSKTDEGEKEFVNFCLEGQAVNKHFEDLKIIRPEVTNGGRCINGLAQNLVSNEYVVRGIKPGDQIKAWPSRNGATMRRTGLNGTQAEWDGDGRLKVLITPF